MPITKTGNNILYLGAGLGAAVGAARAAFLSDKQKKVLRDKYSLDSDASFVLRNAGRGAAGTILGGVAGGLVGSLPAVGIGTAILSHPELAFKYPRTTLALGGIGTASAVLGGPLGMALGAWKATNKYS